MSALTAVLKRPNPNAIEACKALLKQAEAGELLGLVYAVDLRGGEVACGYTDLADRMALVALLEKTKYLLLRAMEEDSV